MARPDQPGLQTINILHVDDDLDLLRLTKTFLESDPQVRVTSTASPLEALRQLEASRFDCLLTDYKMPEKDGLALTREIRSFSDMPIILYMSQGSEEVAEKAFQVGIDAYIRKETHSAHYKVLAQNIQNIVEMHRANIYLKESERQLRSALDNMLEGCQIIDPQYRYLYINNVATRHGRRAKEELLGRPMMECYPGIEETEMFGILAKCMNERVPGKMMNQFRYPDGSTASFELSFRPIPEGVLVLSIDVTEREETLQSLGEGERRYRMLVERSSLPVSVTIGDKIVYVNKKRLELTGHTDPATLIGTSGLDQMHPEDRALIIRRLEARGAGGDVAPITRFRLTRVNGTTIHVEDHVSDVVWMGEKAVIHSLVDVTDRVRYEEQLVALHRYAASLVTAENVSQVAEISLATIKTVLGFSSASFGVVEGGELTFIHALELDGFAYPTFKLDGPGITVRAVNTRTSQLVRDTRLDSSYISRYADDLKRIHYSELDVPVLVDGKAVAVMNVEHEEVDAFDSSDVRLLELLAHHISSALIRLREKQRLGEFSEKLEALHRHTTTLAVSGDYTSVVETTLNTVEAVVGFHFISFMQRRGDCIQSIANRGAALLGKVFKLGGRGITARAAREKRTILVNDLRGDPDYVQGSLKSLSELAVPVVVADEVEAVINVENADLDAFTEEDRIILETLASHVASALQRLREQERQSVYVRSLEALHRYANRLAAAGSVSEVGESTFSIIEEVLGFNIGSFELVSGGYLEAVYTKGIDVENVRALPLDGRGVMVRAVNTGETQLVPDTRLDPDYVSVTVEGTRPRSELAVPVKIGGEVVVVINIESTEVAKFTEIDRVLVEIMAQHVTSALEKMRHVEEVQEMERARARVAVESAAKIGSMVRHDLRGPLAAIGNAAYLLRGNPEDTKVLEIIDRSVSRAAEILEDLRERTWTGSLTPAPTDLVDLIRETVEGLGSPEGVNVALKLHDEVVYGRVDGAKMRRVVENLVLNAFDAMPDGGELRVEEQVNDGCLVLRVSDTGVGIPSERLGKLFTPFFTTKEGGTGLGLVYCRQVAEAHGGTVSVESEAGRGTSFTVKLPLG